MARTDTLGHFLTDVADAIRAKTGSSEAIVASDFDTEIENIPSGGGTVVDVATEQEMNSIPSQSTLGKMYNYTGEEGKYMNGIYKVQQGIVNNGIVLNDIWYCPRETNITYYTLSINCSIGSKIIALISLRDNTYTVSSEWDVLGVSNSIDNNQYMIVATKVAENTMESITVTQGSSQRMYINLLELPSDAVINFNGFKYETTSSNDITIFNQIGIKIYGLSAPSWVIATPYKTWNSSLEEMQYYGANVNSYRQQRQCAFASNITEETEITFTPPVATTIILAEITITNINPVIAYSYYLDIINNNAIFKKEGEQKIGSDILKFADYIQPLNQQTGLYGTFREIVSIGCLDLINVPVANSICSYTSTLKYIGSIKNTNAVTNISQLFDDCTRLVNIPLFDTSNVTNMQYMIRGCRNLSDESLDNILQMAANSKVTSNKTWVSLAEATYTLGKISSLPHYQDFLNAGWTYN